MSKSAKIKNKIDNEERKTELNIHYKILSIQELGFFYNNSKTIGVHSVDKQNLQFVLNHTFNWQKELGIFEFILEIKFNSKVELKDLFGVEFSIKYKLENYDGHITDEGEVFTIPDGLMISLFSIALSTARGYLAAKTAATEYKDFILPILNPKEIIKQSLVD